MILSSMSEGVDLLCVDISNVGIPWIYQNSMEIQMENQYNLRTIFCWEHRSN